MELFLKNKMVPVICPLTFDESGQLLNTNADTISATLSIALSKIFKVNLIYCFEKNGILMDINDDNSHFHKLSESEISTLKSDGIFTNGMLPKIENAFSALNNGVNSVQIGHADNLGKMINNEPGSSTVLTLG